MVYFVYYDLWVCIVVFCKEWGYIFIVYIDDVIILGVCVLKVDVWQVQRMIYGMGLCYYKEKIFVDQFVEIIGVVVCNGDLVVLFWQYKKMYEVRVLFVEVVDDDW